MNILLRRSAVIAALIALAGCATPEIPYDRSAGIKNVGIIAHVSNGPSVVLASDIGQSLGLVGALVDISLERRREEHFRHALEGTGFDDGREINAALTAALSAKGYTTQTLDVPRSSADFLKTYPSPAETHADAYLDAVVENYGYIASGISADSPYRPFLFLHVQLVRAADSKVLMEDRIIYNLVLPPDPLGIGPKVKAVTIAPDPQFVFTNDDALDANGPRAAQGMHDAFVRACDAVGTLLQ